MGDLASRWRQLRYLAIFGALLLLAACNFPTQPSGNLVQTAVALTLTAQLTHGPAQTQAPDETPQPGSTPVATSAVDGYPEPTGKIVYTCQYSKRSGFNQLCIINADGSGQRILTSTAFSDDFFASISPDGASVLFASDRAGRYQIYELVLETEQLIQLTDFEDMHAYAPDVSPDGNQIVFYARASGSYPSSHNVWVMNRDGSDAHSITNRSGGAWDPVWSPDGAYILFASESGGTPQLYIVAADGSDPTRVTNLNGIRGRNDWSPDGVTLTTYIGTAWDRDIYTFDLAGENLRQLTDGFNNLAPSFSPDGNWITFMSYRDHPREDLGCEIYIMRVDGADPRRLTDNDICDWQPRWGP